MKENDIEKQTKKTPGKTVPAKKLRWILLVLVVFLGAIGYSFWRKSSNPRESDRNLNMYTAKRGDLTISRTESGDIKSLNSVDIKCEVEGHTTIIYIVDEGIYVTPEDVNNGMILVELDSSDIKQRLTQQKVTFLNAEASFTDANESLDIQKKQNDSDIKAGQMKVKFALMDLQKYLGEIVAEKLLSGTTNPGSDPNEIASLIEAPNLEGEALQKLRELDGNIYLQKQKLELAKSKLDWTEKLYEKEYVSLNDKEADRLDKEIKDIDLKKAQTDMKLFKLYKFPKEAVTFFSDLEEAKRELERIQARARSELARALAKLQSSEATYLLQKERLAKLEKQLEACTIKAPAPGQVTYYQGRNRWSRTPIAVGEAVRERQKIICIPDSSQMKTEVKVHETWIDKVEPNQPARITVAAFPEKKFTGKVLKKAPLADPENWMNPDLKVYATDVSIDGTHDFLKTGMTAKVEIIVQVLKDIISVPIQAVVSKEDKKVCYMMKNNRVELREVETGEFNDNFVEIKSGLAEGEKVLLNPPRLGEAEKE